MTECELHFQYSRSMARGAFLASFWQTYLVYVVASVLVLLACLVEAKNAEMRPLACFGMGVITMLWWSWLNAYR